MSIKDNLLLGKHEIWDQTRAEVACQQAQIFDFINKLPQKFDTKIKENGNGLSSGQKQRLCLARIFYHRPHVMILDEATSHLDHATEEKILEELNEIKKNHIIMLITHKMQILKYCDLVYKVEGRQFAPYVETQFHYEDKGHEHAHE